MIDDWLLAWLVTFAAHSSLLIGLIWLASSSRLPDAVEESSWKVGAFGAILTSTLQCLWIAEPAGGHLARIGMPLPPPLDGELPASGIPSPLATSNGSSLLLLLLVLASAGALCQAGWRKLRLGRLLAERRRLDDPALLSVLRCVCARSGYRRRVALSSCESLRTPIAFGILRPEICLPGDAPTRLGDAELAAMLAHELAHLRAGDPFWLAAFSMLTWFFPWQPLFRVARRRYRELAEFRCDAAAAESAGRIAVARCLVEVATWLTGKKTQPALSSMALGEGSGLRRRVDRLLGGRPRKSLGWHAYWLLPLLSVLLAGVTAAMPGAGLAEAHSSMELRSHAARSVDLLAALDDECASLSREFTSLRRELEGVKMDPESIRLMRLLAQKLNSLDRKRIELRNQILETLLSPDRIPRRVTNTQEN